jgi:serine/threonine-protein kinase
LLAADAAADVKLASLDAASVPESIFGQDPFGLAGVTVSQFEVREPIGFGGMGVVYKAHDTRLGRDVALKFMLPPYNFDADARARFLREAQAAAALDHPNVCTVYDVCTRDDGSLFIAMALYDGETLRARLTREGRIPTSEALEFARQIAEGLNAAHRAGVVHRDLKPANIIVLPNGSIRIFDFGLATARDETFADSGSRFGTASYMSPEQLRGENVDARADLWALGVVLYEMLSGHKPFVGQDAAAVAHSILNEEPLSLSAHRIDVPEEIERLVMQLLRKDPNERPQTASDVLRVLSDIRTDARQQPERPASRRLLTVSIVAGVVMTLVALFVWWPSPTAAENDERLVAVVPFRVAGDDHSLDYLREGIIDLLAVKLSGATHIADPRSVLAAWQAAGGSESHDIDRPAAIKLGSKFGAHDVLLGTLTTIERRVALRATLIPVKGGPAREVSLESRQDSILPLIDRLAVQLLAFRAGEKGDVSPEIASVPFSAVSEYLEAQRLARRGKMPEAYARYRAATAADSDFAAAWFGAIDVGWWSGEGGGGIPPDTPSRQLVRLRDRLTPAMRAMVDARIGLHYPAIPSLGERYRLAERAAQLAPDNPYAWQYLGDVLFHWGAAAGVEEPGSRAIAAFERALALDSTMRTAIEHLPWLFYERGDTASVRRWLTRALAEDTSAVTGNVYLADAALGDEKRHVQWRAALRYFGALEEMGFLAEDLTLPLHPIDSATTAFAARAVTEGERRWSTWREAGLAHARGQPRREAKLLGSISGLLGDDWPTQVVVLESLFDDADSSLGAKARRALEPGIRNDCVQPMVCTWFTAALYDLLQGNSQTARTVLNRFHSTSPTHCWSEAPTMCAGYAMILDAQLAAEDKRSDAGIRLAKLDSMLRDAPVTLGPLLQAGNLVAARLWERSGDPFRALAALRRRVRLIGKPELYATYLREEGRLAAVTGDRDGARRAYHRYLNLRSDAEPSLQPQVAAVRRELARLERQG